MLVVVIICGEAIVVMAIPAIAPSGVYRCTEIFLCLGYNKYHYYACEISTNTKRTARAP